MRRTDSLMSRLIVRIRPTERPPVAVAIASDGVLAASKTSGSEIKYAFRALPVGAVTANVSQPNLRFTEQIATAVRAALDEVAGGIRSVTLLLPDAAARVFSLEFDSLPDDRTAVLAVLRLRLKRVVPFDVEAAKISYQVLQRDRDVCKVLVVIVPRSVLNDYEAVIRDAGYVPGAVLPSALSALAALDADEPVLSAYLSGTTLTTSITIRNNILLYRTHELPEDSGERTAEIQRDVAVAVAYFEDELKAAPTCLHYAGDMAPEEFSHSVLTRHIPIKELSPNPPSMDLRTQERLNAAGLLGALAGTRCA